MKIKKSLYMKTQLTDKSFKEGIMKHFSSFNKTTLDKVSALYLVVVIACNLLSHNVSSFKNVAEGYIHANNVK